MARASAFIRWTIERRIRRPLEARLSESPAVALLGPRQVGKTTLALEIAEGRPSVYLDLESAADGNRITEPELYFADHPDELVLLDEIHRAPGIFEALRGAIDRGRRENRGLGRFLLLGSAAIDLLAHRGETLAGRIAYLELDPLDVSELGAEAVDRLWTRGGFPESYLAASEAASPRARGERAHRLQLPRPARRPAAGSPGLLHALLTVVDKEMLLGHPVLGASWEGYVIENLIALAPERVEPSFYRTSGGAEIDLVLRWPDGREWAIAVKRSLAPKPSRGMRSAISDIEPERSFIVYAGDDRFRVAEGVEVIGLPALGDELSRAEP